MVRKLMLPVLGPRPSTPTVDLVRRRLGGRASTEVGAGEAVTFTNDGGRRFSGVVLFVRGDELDVWVEETLVCRTRRDRVAPLEPPLSREIAAIASEARTFGKLCEGDLVRYLEEGRVGEGTLVEKCRFGALVERGDGTIVGLGFRRVWAREDPEVSEVS